MKVDTSDILNEIKKLNVSGWWKKIFNYCTRNKKVILFKDISKVAVEEGRYNITEHTNKDNLMSVEAYLNPFFVNLVIL